MKRITERMIIFWKVQEFTFEIREIDLYTEKKIEDDKPRTNFDEIQYLRVLIAKGAQKLNS